MTKAPRSSWDQVHREYEEWQRKQQEQLAIIERLLTVSPAIRGTTSTGSKYEQPRMAIVSGELSDRAEGAYRVTFFGADGPHGHQTKDSMSKIAKAILEAMDGNFAAMSEDDVMAWTTTPEFEVGSRVVGYMQAENTLRWYAQKAGKLDWAYDQIKEANRVGRDRTPEAIEAATEVIVKAIRELPVPNPRIANFVANPPWVTGALADSYETLEKLTPPKWMPQLANVRKVRGNALTAQLVEFGCGAYGCVLPTLDPKIVLKVTTDETEAMFAADLAPDLVAPICVEYPMVAELSAHHDGMQVHLLWREAAEHVGKLREVLGDYAEKIVTEQHEAAKRAYDAVFHAHSPTMVRARISFWLEMCERMATQVKVPELRALGAGFVEIYERQRILFGDVHAGNLGLVTRGSKKLWLITDPGHVAVLPEENPMSYVRERIPGGKAAGRHPSEFNQVELRRGTKVEMEHTTDPLVAQEIAMDHLVEDPLYYQKLARIHRD